MAGNLGKSGLPLIGLPMDALRELQEAIRENNEAQIQLVTKVEHLQEHQRRMQVELDGYYEMLFKDNGGKFSIQTTLARMDDRLRSIEKTNMCMRRGILAIAIPLGVGIIMWIGGQFFELVMRSKLQALPQAPIHNTVPHTQGKAS